MQQAVQDKSIAWLSMLISCTGYSPCCSAKISDTPPPAKKIKDKEEFILVHSWRVQSITEGKPRWQDAEGVGHVTSAVRKQRKASFLSPRYLVWNSSSEKVSSTWGGSARLSKPSLEACSQAPWFVSMTIPRRQPGKAITQSHTGAGVFPPSCGVE